MNHTIIATKLLMQSHKVCVLVPTYNNAQTLIRVLNGIRVYTSDIIVVNDGSTDQTANILQQYKDITIVTFDRNKGKGKALRVGFDKALSMGFQYALTIDSDGQHYPDDIPLFINALNSYDEPVLIIGNRDMDKEGVPKNSNFGNRFSNFWFRVETGIKLPDTQSGYRLYPLKNLSENYFTIRYDFEIEVLVRAAWNDVHISSVPIGVRYDEKERVSHFHPFWDFARISLLNTILVLIAIIYIKPRNFFRNLKKKVFGVL